MNDIGLRVFLIGNDVQRFLSTIILFSSWHGGIWRFRIRLEEMLPFGARGD